MLGKTTSCPTKPCCNLHAKRCKIIDGGSQAANVWLKLEAFLRRGEGFKLPPRTKPAAAEKK